MQLVFARKLQKVRVKPASLNKIYLVYSFVLSSGFDNTVQWLNLQIISITNHYPCRRDTMPKIVRFHQTGAADFLKLEDLPLSEPGKGEVRLKVDAIGLNRAEVMF